MSEIHKTAMRDLQTRIDNFKTRAAHVPSPQARASYLRSARLLQDQLTELQEEYDDRTKARAAGIAASYGIYQYLGYPQDYIEMEHARRIRALYDQRRAPYTC